MNWPLNYIRRGAEFHDAVVADADVEALAGCARAVDDTSPTNQQINSHRSVLQKNLQQPTYAFRQRDINAQSRRSAG